MADLFKNITCDNIENEHLCCAIADKKHQCGVEVKKQWLKGRLNEGHVFRKLDEKGKVFIEYAPLETAWVPVIGDNYIYIYCLWVSGSFKGNGYAKALLEYCVADAKKQGKRKNRFYPKRSLWKSMALLWQILLMNTSCLHYLLMAQCLPLLRTSKSKTLKMMI